MRKYSRLSMVTASVAVAVVTLAACGGSPAEPAAETSAAPAAETSAAPSEAAATAGDVSLDGGGKSISVFMPSTSNNYIAEWRRGMEAVAADLNFKVTVVENNFDQAEQDLQVQQALASGEMPDIYVYWPSDAKAGIASLRALSQSGIPVVIANQSPQEEALPFVTMYAGANDFLNGQTAGELMLGAREAAKAAGKQFASPGGNLIELQFVAGYQASVDRNLGFNEATSAAPFNNIATEFAGFDNEAGYKVMSQLIPANKAKGIDFVYAHNDALAAGAMKALEEAGLVPGKDVYVVGGTCHGDLTALESGKQYGTGLQAARLEGNVVTLAVARYFANGGTVTEGEDSPEPLPEFPTTTAPPAFFNYIPNPGIVFSSDQAANVALLDDTLLWGDTMRNLCTY